MLLSFCLKSTVVVITLLLYNGMGCRRLQADGIDDRSRRPPPSVRRGHYLIANHKMQLLLFGH